MKKISVIIPVYNAEKTIRRCLESIMSSEYEEYEVIVVDDGSTDNSASILFEYANRDVSASKEGVVLFPPPIDILGKTNIF